MAPLWVLWLPGFASRRRLCSLSHNFYSRWELCLFALKSPSLSGFTLFVLNSAPSDVRSLSSFLRLLPPPLPSVGRSLGSSSACVSRGHSLWPMLLVRHADRGRIKPISVSGATRVCAAAMSHDSVRVADPRAVRVLGSSCRLFRVCVFMLMIASYLHLLSAPVSCLLI